MGPSAHLWNLLQRTWLRVLVWHSATTFSIIREIVILPIAILLLTLWWTLRKEQWWAWAVLRTLPNRGGEVMKSFAILITVLLAILGAVFIAAIPVTIYQDHQESVNEKLLLKDECSRLRKQVEEMQVKLAAGEKELATARTSSHLVVQHYPESKPIRDPDSFYQFGQVVATVSGAVVDLPKSRISFEAIRPNSSLNSSRNVEYRDWFVECKDGGRELPSATLPSGTGAGVVNVGPALGWVCNIVGKK